MTSEKIDLLLNLIGVNQAENILSEFVKEKLGGKIGVKKESREIRKVSKSSQRHHSYAPWTPEEIELLKKRAIELAPLVNNNATKATVLLAQELKRTTSSVQNRIAIEGGWTKFIQEELVNA